MAGYRRTRGYARSGNKYFYKKCNQRVGKAMTKLIRNTVQTSTEYQVKTNKTDPPMFQTTRKMKRTIRYLVPATDSNVTVDQVLKTEAAYYGLAAGSIRWRGLKMLATTVYGVSTLTDDQPLQVSFPQARATTSADQDESFEHGLAGTSFVDYPDKNHRAVVKVIHPPTKAFVLPASNVQNPVILCSFTAGRARIIDFYVELD